MMITFLRKRQGVYMRLEVNPGEKNSTILSSHRKHRSCRRATRRENRNIPR